MYSKTFPWAGWSLIATGVIHNAVGLFIAWNILIDAFNAGGIGVWDNPPERGFAYWFLAFGFMCMIAGVALCQIERAHLRPARALIWALGIFGLVGVITMPASGLWLIFISVVLLARQRRRQAT